VANKKRGKKGVPLAKEQIETACGPIHDAKGKRVGQRTPRAHSGKGVAASVKKKMKTRKSKEQGTSGNRLVFKIAQSFKNRD